MLWGSLVYLKLLLRWLISFTRITYLCKLIGLHSLAALPQLQILWGGLVYLKLLLRWLLCTFSPMVFHTLT
ncbi:hypothetical protein CEQ28_009530 [Hafnia alvei]|nr:hypothetical protein CEQ28_009530 [Hafnia alvei]